MSDTKKPGAKNIQDLKAKLGLKKPGGATPPPAVTPPPGVAAPGDDLPAPPGVEPPAGVKPPPAVTPPPGIAPPVDTAPAVAPPPAGGIVAPPGFEPPAPAAAPAASAEPAFGAGSAEPVDIDLDAVHGKKSRNIVWILIAALACLLTMCGGYYFGDARLKTAWSKKSKKSCETTAAIVKKLHRGASKFEGIFEQELDKTKDGRTPLKFYNPDLFTKLDEATAAFDTTNPKLKGIMKKQVWMTHYRFVKNAGELLPRLHEYLATLLQIKLAVSTAKATEAQYAQILKKKTKGAKTGKAAKRPHFGALIKGDNGALFAGLGKPCKDGKPIDEKKIAEATGYELPNGKCYSFTKPATGSNCATYSDTLRIFSPTDQELVNRLKCKGQEDVVFKAWTYNVLQIKLLLKQLKQLNGKDIYQKFQKSARAK